VTTREVSYNLEGVVRNQGLPVAGTTIMLYDYWSSGSGLIRHYLTEVTTGPKGDFGFDVRKGIYSIEVVPNRDTRFARQSFDAVKVTANTVVNVSLKHGSTYSGKVRTESGAKLGKCELLFFGIEPEVVRANEPIGEDGKFSVALPKGRYYVACRQLVEAPSHQDPQTGFLCANMHVIDLYSDLREDFVVPDLVPFKGVVTNSDGHPILGVRCTIGASGTTDNPHDEEAQLRAVAFTNKRGEFECLVAPGTYDVKLEPGSDTHLSERLVSAILVDHPRTRTYSLAAGYRLFGRVTFDDDPVESALVTVFGGKIDSSTVTDKNGLFSFSLSGGTYELSVAPQPDSLATMPFRLLAPVSMKVKLAEDTKRDIELQRGVGLSGKVVDKQGAGRPGVQLALYPVASGNGTMSDTDRPLAFGITGDDGSFEFRVLPGKYWLVLNNQRSTARIIEAVDFDLESDLVWGAGCMVRFEVTSENDEPIGNCRISCETYGGVNATAEQPPTAVTGEDGTCMLIVPAGIYSFKVEPPEHGSFQSKQIRQLSINSDTKRRVKLGAKEVASL
jgi:hypothetical protein